MLALGICREQIHISVIGRVILPNKYIAVVKKDANIEILKWAISLNKDTLTVFYIRLHRITNHMDGEIGFPWDGGVTGHINVIISLNWYGITNGARCLIIPNVGDRRVLLWGVIEEPETAIFFTEFVFILSSEIVSVFDQHAIPVSFDLR